MHTGVHITSTSQAKTLAHASNPRDPNLVSIVESILSISQLNELSVRFSRSPSAPDRRGHHQQRRRRRRRRRLVGGCSHRHQHPLLYFHDWLGRILLSIGKTLSCFAQPILLMVSLQDRVLLQKVLVKQLRSDYEARCL